MSQLRDNLTTFAKRPVNSLLKVLLWRKILARLNMNNRTGLYRGSVRNLHQYRHMRLPFRDKGNVLITMDRVSRSRTRVRRVTRQPGVLKTSERVALCNRHCVMKAAHCRSAHCSAAICKFVILSVSGTRFRAAPLTQFHSPQKRNRPRPESLVFR